MKKTLVGILTIASLVTLIYSDVLFSDKPLVLSEFGEDLTEQYINWREFGFKSDNIVPLWNPYIYSGAPFMSGFQSALFYPVNQIHRILPTYQAINLEIVINVFLAGMFMFLFATRMKLSTQASILSAIVFMFSGPYISHVIPGHLSNLATMAFIPAVLMCVREVLLKPSFLWFLSGVLAVSMQILAGHPQYVFYTAMIVGMYSIFILFNTDVKKKNILLVGVIYVVSALSTAVQLLPGIEATMESIRSSGVPYEFSSSFHFIPENLLTLVWSNVFGDYKSYYGAYNFWEMNIFIGISATLFVLFGIKTIRKSYKPELYSFLVCLLLSFGVALPLYDVLFHYMPFFDGFRGVSKFVSIMVVFLALFAGIGFDKLYNKVALGNRLLVHIVWILAVLELSNFAYNHPLFDFNRYEKMETEFVEFAEEFPKDTRFYNRDYLNMGMSTKVKDLWGSDPFVLRRYAEFIAYSQEKDFDRITQDLRINKRINTFMELVGHRVHLNQTVVPNHFLTYSHRVVETKEDIFRGIEDPWFHYSSLMLEEEPNFIPKIGQDERHFIKRTDIDGDAINFELYLSEPKILVVMNSFSKGWRVISNRKTGGQKEYKVIPAFYSFQAIPLDKGMHDFDLVYIPFGYILGLVISIGTLLSTCLICFFSMFSVPRRS